MGETDGGVRCVHALASRARCTEQIQTDVIPAEVHVKFSGFREYGNGSRGSLDPALGLGLGHPLDAVYTALVFHNAVNSVVSAELEDNLLVAAGGAGSLVCDFQLPASLLCELGIHPEQVAGKDCSLVAAGAAADFYHCVLGVVRIGRDEHKPDVLLHLRELGLNLVYLVTGHLTQLVVLLVEHYIFCGCKVIQHLLVLVAGLDDRLQLFVVLVQLDKLLHIRYHGGIGQLLLQGIELILKAEDFIK